MFWKEILLLKGVVLCPKRGMSCLWKVNHLQGDHQNRAFLNFRFLTASLENTEEKSDEELIMGSNSDFPSDCVALHL